MQELIEGLPFWCLWLNGQDLWCEVTTILCSFVTLKKKTWIQFKIKISPSPQSPSSSTFSVSGLCQYVCLFSLFFSWTFMLWKCVHLYFCTCVSSCICKCACVCSVHIYWCMHACDVWDWCWNHPQFLLHTIHWDKVSQSNLIWLACSGDLDLLLTVWITSGLPHPLYLLKVLCPFVIIICRMRNSAANYHRLVAWVIHDS